MQTLEIVIFTVIAMTMWGALSLAIYKVLPPSLLERGARHGRFAGFGTSGLVGRTPSGNATTTPLPALQGQSV